MTKDVIITENYVWQWDYEPNGVISKTDGRWVPSTQEVKTILSGVPEEPEAETPVDAEDV